MSAFRALRQLTTSSSRVLATRTSLSRVVLPSFRSSIITPSTRAFSVSARRFGEGASAFSSDICVIVLILTTVLLLFFDLLWLE